nr:AMP-binding protein [Nitrosarchaeum sp.]
DETGNNVPPNTKGYLVINNPWPGMLLTLWGDDEKYRDVYWSKYKNCYYAGDYALQDTDGYFWLLGRADDVLKVSGHRIGTAELESCIVSHTDVSESAVCGIPDEIKGEAIIAFVVLKQNIQKNNMTLQNELLLKIRNDIGAIATPAQIYFVSVLPKTRSGKIMRRLLKAIANKEIIGDTSTLENVDSISEIQSIFEQLQESIQKKSE